MMGKQLHTILIPGMNKSTIDWIETFLFPHWVQNKTLTGMKVYTIPLSGMKYSINGNENFVIHILDIK